MEIRSYNHELELANLLFVKLFRNITIERRTKNSMKQIPVKCVIGNRSRIFKDLENPEKKATYTFPLIVVTRTGIQTEPDRIANLHNEIKYQQYSGQHLYDLMTPNPVAINYSVTIISKNQGMNDMIMSNFIPFFNKDLFVSCVHPKFTNVKYNSQVIMDSSITEEHPEELAGTDDDFVVNTCSFTLKTFLFAGTQNAKAGQLAKTILSTYWDEELSAWNVISVDSIYDGFMPVIQKIQLDMHAVRYLDPTLPKYQTSVITKTYLCADLSGNPILDKDGNRQYYNHDFSVDVAANNPYAYYAIDKYFYDISVGNWYAEDVDTLRWHIDEAGNFTLDAKDWWGIGHD